MPADPQLSRRVLLAAGVVGATLVSGCGEARSPAAGSADDPDSTLVDEVVARITATAEISARVPDLVALHTAHLGALDAPPPVAATAPPARLLRSERQLQRFLVDAALRAESGPLARLLASMSAAVSQQLAVL
ncbi:hypothetical protein ASC77_04130 [Nocardioides sp. Root1257]|uniref:hypothetical protein n=1 Tax=unclassified Nocardioides TaxID=2615069 RepID=UPI0006FE2E33|nr:MULTISPECIES: hypothetical protein [unclassified Nocardioides]KQW53478.1 hypothetical protein ASC77_04130 [Nocardioides sp. Root1257]KRC56164.1 hypothetical protein ASE24_04130 [Nocardioides sp. Root224]